MKHVRPKFFVILSETVVDSRRQMSTNSYKSAYRLFFILKIHAALRENTPQCHTSTQGSN